MKNTNYPQQRVFGHGFKRSSFIGLNKTLSVITLILTVAVFSGVLHFKTVNAAGIDNVAVTFSDSEATGTETRVVVTFTPTSAFTASSNFYIYLGEDTGGDEFTDGDADQTGADIACTQTGTAFNNGNQADASATLPMYYYIEVDTVGAGTGAVSCTLGSGATDGPSTPAVADNYSVAVVTENDSGAGIGYVGNANDITVSVSVLPNLSLLIDNADGTRCTTSSGITTCNLGTVLTTTIAQGNYDVNVGTNAGSGATIKIAEDGNLRNGADEIADATEGDTIAAGTTDYGIAVASDAAWTEAGDFTDDDTPIPSGPADVASTSGPISISGNDITVTHKVAVDSTVKALTYSHIVTWTATANF